MKQKLACSVEHFHLPCYTDLPNIGLYLEQTTIYINQLLAPLDVPELTGSMIRNYVKKGLIANPVKKLYFAPQIAHLIVLTLLKQVLSLENIQQLFQRQKPIYTDQVAYDYFCKELENILGFQFELKDTLEDIGVTSTTLKHMLRSAIFAVSNVIYLNRYFNLLSQEETTSGIVQEFSL